MAEREFDVVVLGGGAGRRGVRRAARRRRARGGDRGAAPGRRRVLLLRLHAVEGAAAAGRAAGRGAPHPGRARGRDGELDVDAVLERRDEIIHDLDDSRHGAVARPRRGSTLVRGHGRLDGERRVRVGRRVAGRAPGGRGLHRQRRGGAADRRPARGQAVEQPRGDDRQVGARAAGVLGGGVVGVEMAQAWSSLGSQVTLVEAADRLIAREEPFACEDVADGAARARRGRAARGQGHGGARAPAARSRWGSDRRPGARRRAARGDRPRAGHRRHRARDGRPRAGQADRGGRPDAGGNDWLYAIGDVNGRVLLTHMGKYQARIAAEVILGGTMRADHRGRRALAARDLHGSAGGGGGLHARGRARGGARTCARSTCARRATPAPASTAARRGGHLAAGGRRGPRRDRGRDVHRAGDRGVPARGDDRGGGRGSARPPEARHPSFPTRSEVWLYLLESMGSEVAGAARRGARARGALRSSPRHGDHLRRPSPEAPRATRARCWPRATSRTSRGSGWCAPTARWPRASASVGCSRRRACRSGRAGGHAGSVGAAGRASPPSLGRLDDQDVAARPVRHLVRHAAEYPARPLHALAAEHDQVGLLSSATVKIAVGRVSRGRAARFRRRLPWRRPWRGRARRRP